MMALCLLFDRKESWDGVKHMLKDKWLLKRMNMFKIHRVPEHVWKRLEVEYTRNESWNE